MWVGQHNIYQHQNKTAKEEWVEQTIYRTSHPFPASEPFPAAQSAKSHQCKQLVLEA